MDVFIVHSLVGFASLIGLIALIVAVLKKRITWGASAVPTLMVSTCLALTLSTSLNLAKLQRSSDMARAKSDVVALRDGLELYAIDNDDMYPATLRGLQGGKVGYIRDDYFVDPWGNAYVYDPPTSDRLPEYGLYSAGPDGRAGTSDDITHKTRWK